MAILYYGGGRCNVEGNVGSLKIYYRGNIVIASKLPNRYVIGIGNGNLIINTDSRIQNLHELFNYLGEFRVTSVTADNLEGEREPISIKMVMDYSELLETKAEDLTAKSEDLKVTYLQGRTFRRTTVLPKGKEIKLLK